MTSDLLSVIYLFYLFLYKICFLRNKNELVLGISGVTFLIRLAEDDAFMRTIKIPYNTF